MQLAKLINYEGQKSEYLKGRTRKIFFLFKISSMQRIQEKDKLYNYDLHKQYKIRRGKRELQNGISASQVAEKYGYETVNGFNKAYKKKYGYPPSLERKLQNEKK